jgi:hypothetical protein
MEDDMVADAALWVILAIAILFLWYGCRMTRPVPNAVDEPSDAIDRAA